MSTPLLPKLFYLATPEPGKHMLNIQFQNGDFMQIQVNNSQLANLVADGAIGLRDTVFAATKAGS